MLAADVLISPNANELGASLSGLSLALSLTHSLWSLSPPSPSPVSLAPPISLVATSPSPSLVSAPLSLSGRYLRSPSLSLSRSLSLLPPPPPPSPLSSLLCSLLSHTLSAGDS